MLPMTTETTAVSDPDLKVARDPNADLSELGRVAAFWPREVLANPAFELALLINTTPLSLLFKPPALAALARQPDTPALLIEHALERIASYRPDREVIYALLSNPALAPDQLERVATAIIDTSDAGNAFADRQGALDNHALIVNSPTLQAPGAPDRRPTLEILREQFTRSDFRVSYIGLEHFAATGLVNHLMPSALLDADATLPDPELQALAASPVTPPAALERLAANASPEVQTDLAANPNAPAGVLEKLYHNCDTRLRTRVAANANVTDAMRQSILAEANGTVLTGLARNPRLTREEESAFVERDDSTVHQFLCLNPNISEEAQVKLARRADPEVARQLLRRPNLTPAAVQALTGNPDRVVAKAAAAYDPQRSADRHPLVRLRGAISSAGSYHLRLITATCANTPGWLLGYLGSSYDALVRLAVAAHPNTLPDTRALLARDPDLRVQRAAQEPPCL